MARRRSSVGGRRPSRPWKARRIGFSGYAQRFNFGWTCATEVNVLRISVFSLAVVCLAGCSLLRSEADAAQRFVDKSFSRCGNSYLGAVPGRIGTSFSEIRGLSVSTRSNGITDADRLNGYEWSGNILIQCNSIRDFNSFRGWSEWYSGCASLTSSVITVPLSERKGRWFFYGNAPDTEPAGGWAGLMSGAGLAGAQSEASYNPKRISCTVVPNDQ
jgi:hypothetical protein